jgi:hypothetical protein
VTVLRVTAGLGAIGFGLLLIAAAAAFGDCAAFGGRCPREPSFDAEVFWMSALGAALASGAPLYLFRPSRRRLVIGLVTAAVAAGLVGVLVTGSTAS